MLKFVDLIEDQLQICAMICLQVHLLLDKPKYIRGCTIRSQVQTIIFGAVIYSVYISFFRIVSVIHIRLLKNTPYV